MKLAREQGDIETVGWGHMLAAWLAYFRESPRPRSATPSRRSRSPSGSADSFSRAWAWFWLGLAERMRGEWRRAIEALERSRGDLERAPHRGRGRRLRLAVLGESYLGLGDVERARALAEEALEIARARDARPVRRICSLALARVLLGSAGPAARAEIEAALARALELARDTSAKAFEPMIHVELAELARQSGDEEGRERELREAHRLFTEIGATGQAERLAGELATLAS